MRDSKLESLIYVDELRHLNQRARKFGEGAKIWELMCFHAEFIHISVGARLLYARSDYSADLAHLNARSQ
jgi:hypothetical protein